MLLQPDFKQTKIYSSLRFRQALEILYNVYMQIERRPERKHSIYRTSKYIATVANGEEDLRLSAAISSRLRVGLVSKKSHAL